MRKDFTKYFILVAVIIVSVFSIYNSNNIAKDQKIITKINHFQNAVDIFIKTEGHFPNGLEDKYTCIAPEGKKCYFGDLVISANDLEETDFGIFLNKFHKYSNIVSASDVLREDLNYQIEELPVFNYGGQKYGGGLIYECLLEEEGDCSDAQIYLPTKKALDSGLILAQAGSTQDGYGDDDDTCTRILPGSSGSCVGTCQIETFFSCQEGGSESEITNTSGNICQPNDQISSPTEYRWTSSCGCQVRYDSYRCDGSGGTNQYDKWFSTGVSNCSAIEDNTCNPADCAGVVGGNSEINDCGICSLDPNEGKDACGVCFGGINDPGQCGGGGGVDCLGVVGGGAVVDDCGICDGKNRDVDVCGNCFGGVQDPDQCIDECPYDPNKTRPGVCGCGRADIDSDGDGVYDCNDQCPNDPNKTFAGSCGCGNPEDVDVCGVCRGFYGDSGQGATDTSQCGTDFNMTVTVDAVCSTENPEVNLTVSWDNLFYADSYEVYIYSYDSWYWDYWYEDYDSTGFTVNLLDLNPDHIYGEEYWVEVYPYSYDVWYDYDYQSVVTPAECPDCNGVVGGSARLDQCGVCGGTNECLDCNGTPNGGAEYDECGVCGGNNSCFCGSAVNVDTDNANEIPQSTLCADGYNPSIVSPLTAENKWGWTCTSQSTSRSTTCKTECLTLGMIPDNSGVCQFPTTPSGFDVNSFDLNPRFVPNTSERCSLEYIVEIPGTATASSKIDCFVIDNEGNSTSILSAQNIAPGTYQQRYDGDIQPRKSYSVYCEYDESGTGANIQSVSTDPVACVLNPEFFEF